MLPRRGDVISGGIFLDHLDVRGEAAARMHTLEQVVAEHSIIAGAIRESRLKGGDVVDSLAAVRTLAEQVLIDIRDGERVGINATARPGKDALEN